MFIKMADILHPKGGKTMNAQYPVTLDDLRGIRRLIREGDAQGVRAKISTLLDCIEKYDDVNPCKCDKCDKSFSPEDMWYYNAHSYCVKCAQIYDIIKFATNHPRAMPAFNLNQIADCFDPTSNDPEINELVESFLAEIEDDL